MDAAFDVVVVGARCAGSPLAALLAREGLSVAVVDRAEFPSDTLSTHIFQNEGVRVLERLGVLDEVLASGAPWLERNRLRVEGLRIDAAIPRRADDPGPWLCVRRPLLDTVLVDAARKAGADVRTGTTVVGLVQEDGRVSGVSVRAQGGDEVLRAPLVVGADGMKPTLGRVCGFRSGEGTEQAMAERLAGGSAAEWEGRLVEAGIPCEVLDLDGDLAALPADPRLGDLFEPLAGTSVVPGSPWSFSA
ncbi:MAG: FAD-dependent monooxygenase [Actinobacteria bacterium]|nr:FAD-dependent monooxygenase [Actinomycetota bacterium]